MIYRCIDCEKSFDDDRTPAVFVIDGCICPLCEQHREEKAKTNEHQYIGNEQIKAFARGTGLAQVIGG